MAAEALLSRFIQVLLDKAATSAIRQISAIWGFEDGIDKLRGSLLWVQKLLLDAEERSSEEPAVKNSLLALKDAAYDAEDLLEDFDLLVPRRPRGLTGKVSDFFSSSNPLLLRLQLQNRLQEIAQKIDHIVQEMNKFGFREKNNLERSHPNSRSETYSFMDTDESSQVIGRGKDRERIVEQVIGHRSHDLAVLPIAGMGGLGKTTLAKLIYNDPKVVDHFKLRMWVCPPEDFNFAATIKAILQSATRAEIPQLSLDLIQERLRQELIGKRYLLVLDDVWNENENKWVELMRLISFGESDGNVVIVTTRSSRASDFMQGTLETYHLPPLDEDDAWSVFEKRAFARGTGKTAELVRIGKEIVSKCKGLPLAAKAMGGLMADMSNEREWLTVLQSEVWDMKVRDSDILPALKLSYDHLPSHLKQCFAFCSMFPKDHKIEIGTLILLWMANGFIPVEQGVELEAKGIQIFHELTWRSFFQEISKYDSDLSTCKIHDLMHDLAKSVMLGECTTVETPSQLDKLSKSTRHMYMAVDPDQPVKVHKYIRGIRTLYMKRESLMSQLEFTRSSRSSAYKSLRALHAVDLPDKLAKPLSSLSQTLKHLRYLDLSNSQIQALPESTSTLVYLQTLKLSYCNKLQKLPQGMRYMNSLRHIFINGCSSLKQMPKGIGELRYLRILTDFVVGQKVGGRLCELRGLGIEGNLEIRNLENVRDVSDAQEASLYYKNLISLKLRWSNTSGIHHQEILEALKPSVGLQVLIIQNYSGLQFPTWTMNSLSIIDLVHLVISGCSKCQHLPPLAQLPLLEILVLERMDNIKYIYSTSTIRINESYGNKLAFPKLKKLTLRSMRSLVDWLDILAYAADQTIFSFPSLIFLEVYDCPRLVTFPHIPSVQELKLLNQKSESSLLNISKSLKYLVGRVYPELGYLIQSHNHEEITGLKISLQILILDNCNWFSASPLASSSAAAATTTQIGKFWMNLIYLTELTIENCDALVYWPLMELQGLTSLKKLWISQCENLSGLSPTAKIIAAIELPQHIEHFSINKCHSLTEIPRFPTSLKELRITICPKLESLPKGMQGLTSLLDLTIIDCPRLISLPEGMQGLTSLYDLTISNCPRLISLPEGMQGLTSLLYLTIIDCPRLISLPEGMQGLTSLHVLTISNCPRLISLPEGMQGLTSLLVLNILNCPRLISFPEGLQQILPGLKILNIDGCPDLERRCKTGGEYWHLVSYIPCFMFSE